MNKTLASWIGKAAYEAIRCGELTGKAAHRRAGGLASGYLDYGIDLNGLDPVVAMRRELELPDVDLPYQELLGPGHVRTVKLETGFEGPRPFIEMWWNTYYPDNNHTRRTFSLDLFIALLDGTDVEPSDINDGVTVTHIAGSAVIKSTSNDTDGGFSFVLTSKQISAFCLAVNEMASNRTIKVAHVGAILDQSLVTRKSELYADVSASWLAGED